MPNHTSRTRQISRLQHGSATVGVLVFLVGIGLVAFAFKLAYDMFITPPEAVLSPGKDSAIDINSLTSNLFQVVVKVILLIVMAAIGSMVANRGIKLYASPRKGVAKPKAEKPKEKSAKTDA
ncbi:MAG: hypothetical protein KDC26_11445 [Armatimonadetes bacterium]|nr:hypothetical protein [Armatimonadota bacterium]